MRESPVNRALNLPRLNYGVGQKALGLCWGPGALAAVLVGTSAGWLWALLPIGVAMLLHGLLRWLFKKEPRVFEIYAKYAVLADEYHPHAREKLPQAFERPHKVGRGLRI